VRIGEAKCELAKQFVSSPRFDGKIFKALQELPLVALQNQKI
jgi:hypothetical protein